MQIAIGNNPLRGAAYRILYERFLPFDCATRGHFDEIKAEFVKLADWAKTECDAPTAAAYAWAASEIAQQIEARLSQHTLGDRINAAYAAMPRPAGWWVDAPSPDATSEAQQLEERGG